MSDQPTQPENTTDKSSQPESDPPDGRGPRPSDPVELAKWIVEQATEEDDDNSSS